MSTVIISNGFNKFPLAVVAAEVSQRGLLAQLLTGAYPTTRVKTALALSRLSRHRKTARLLAREQPLDEALIRPLWLSEAVHELAANGQSLRVLRPLAERLDAFSLRLYGRQAVQSIVAAREATRIYHYRSGFGHRSAVVARERGMLTLCDHSIAHPAVLEYLVDNNGKLPSPGADRVISPLWSDVLEDIENADEVVVNSDFVKRTFVEQGWNLSNVHVIYMGVENRFLEAIPPRPSAAATVSPELRLLFAGTVGRRKGAHVLLAALASLDDLPWRLQIIGPVEPEIREHHATLLRDPRIELVGTVQLDELARRMAAADVFVFPSLAEGSARVVFMALASGCYLITTPNAGSIVEDGVHGALVPPGDAAAVAGAVRAAAADRELVADIGRKNAKLIRTHYRQEHYGAALLALYDSLLGSKAGAST